MNSVFLSDFILVTPHVDICLFFFNRWCKGCSASCWNHARLLPCQGFTLENCNLAREPHVPAQGNKLILDMISVYWSAWWFSTYLSQFICTLFRYIFQKILFRYSFVFLYIGRSRKMNVKCAPGQFTVQILIRRYSLLFSMGCFEIPFTCFLQF